MWKLLLALAALVLVCAIVVSFISDDDWAKTTDFILTALGIIFGTTGVFLQRQTTW